MIDDQIQKLKRYAQVTTSIGGLMSRMGAEKYLGVTIDHDAYAKILTEFLGSLKGPMMKIGQFLAVIPDAIPEAYRKDFESLQNQCPPMGLPFVQRRMKMELGDNWKTYFTEFDLKPFAAASLGQVHKAVTKEGKTVACKLQYPNMHTIVEADLQQLEWFSGLYKKFYASIDLTDIKKEIRDVLYEELNYEKEAQNTLLYHSIFEATRTINIPKPDLSLSTKGLMVMDWLEGAPLFSKQWTQDEADILGGLLFQAWYHPLCRYGVIHGDPHPGNYTVTQDLRINLLDFGCIKHFPKNFLEGVILLYQSLIKDDKDIAVSAYEKWGFEHLTKDLIETLNHWAHLLYEPLLDDRVRPIQENFVGDKGWKVAQHVHQELHKMGGIKPPRSFVYMDRACVGIGSVIMRLGSKQNWHQQFEKLIESVLVESPTN